MFRSVVLLLVTAACADGPLALNDPDRFTTEDGVYTEVIDSLILGRANRVLVVVDSAPAFDALPHTRDAASFETLSSATVRDFETINAVRRAVTVSALQTSGPVLIVGEAELLEMASAGSAQAFWNAFYARFPSAMGLAWLSRAGLKPDRTQALVVYRFECGPACGDRATVLLGRRAQRWSVTQMVSPLQHN